MLAEVDGVPAGLAGGYPDLPGLLHVVAMWVDPAARRAYERYGFVATGETRPLREGAAEVVERLVLR